MSYIKIVSRETSHRAQGKWQMEVGKQAANSRRMSGSCKASLNGRDGERWACEQSLGDEHARDAHRT